MLAKDIIKSARYILSDTPSTRWTDGRLLALINDGLADIAKTTILFTSVVYAAISDLVTDYDLSSIMIKLHRAEYLGIPLDMFTFEEMDRKCPGWQLHKGNKPKAIIYNHQNQGNFKLYPAVENAENSNIIFSQAYGIITNISYSEIEVLTVDQFGDLGSFVDTGYLKIFYTRRHPQVIDINATIEINSLALEPLAHYVAGRALRDNVDVQNRTVGNEELAFYAKSLEDYSNEKAENFSKATIYQTEYRPV